MKPVITSLLEDDLYKFSMWQALLHNHPATEAEYTFRCRSRPHYPLSQLKDEVEEQLEHVCSLRFTPKELDYLARLRFIKRDFVDFLSVFHLQRRFIEVGSDGDDLTIVARGPQIHIMDFEMRALPIVSELYYRRFDQDRLLEEGRRRLAAKINHLKTLTEATQAKHPLTFFDFGLRRRFSQAWHEEVVTTLAHELPGIFKGTSNVYLARRLGLTPIGTMSHEYLQAFQGFEVRLRDFQKAALEEWVHEYRGDLGVALTDVISMDAFLADFDLYFAKLFDGLRHDSGDPVIWGEKAIAHYQKLGIDPCTKRLIFSDSLDFDKAVQLYRHFGDRTRTAFGIGTYLTNDLGIEPLNIVMKLTRCNGQPVAKLSDEPGKSMCEDATFLAYLRQVFNYQVESAEASPGSTPSMRPL